MQFFQIVIEEYSSALKKTKQLKLFEMECYIGYEYRIKTK
ncbi:hypothetical protein B4134_2806 [Bacillus safensis]|nr:hypothetical protein B4134_2806 [Bacillus safensis]